MNTGCFVVVMVALTNRGSGVPREKLNPCSSISLEGELFIDQLDDQLDKFNIYQQ